MNMELLQNVYGNSLEENEKNILFWEKHIQELLALDLNRFVKNLTVPILVPIGSRIFFRGELKHTNEVTVSLGADYFAKCSVEQAHLLIKHRVEVAQSKLVKLRIEKDFLQKYLSLSEKTFIEDSGTDIVEFVSEEQDKNWRKEHRENVRKYKQRKVNNNELPANEMSNEQLWSRLEELELQEELDNELQKDDVDVSKPAAETDREDSKNIDMRDREQLNTDDSSDDESENENVIYLPHHRRSIFQQPSKFQLFEQVVARHKELKKKIAQIRSRQGKLVTQEDIIRRVGEMERLEALEDEIAILEDMLASDDDDIEEGEEDDSADKQEKKSVAFVDDDDCDTFEVTFKHSEVEPSSEPYDPQKGITKPSDIHQAYLGCFSGETTSILKKPKYDTSPVTSQTKPIVEENPEKEDVKADSNLNSTIVVRDVVEKTDCNDKNANQNGRPMSLFKKRRQQLKE